MKRTAPFCIFAVAIAMVLAISTIGSAGPLTVAPSGGGNLAVNQVAVSQPSAGLSDAAGQQVSETYGGLSHTFIPNAGQTDSKVLYYSQGSRYGVYFTREEAVFAFLEKSPQSSRGEMSNREPLRNQVFPKADQETRGMALALRFVEANPEVSLEGRVEGTGRVNYFKGKDPAKWRTDLPTYQEVAYRELWPGVDLYFEEKRVR